MHYVTISFTHKNTPLDIREKLAFNNEDKLLSFYKILNAIETVNESVIVSTCNRVEFVISTKNIKISELVLMMLYELSNVDLKILEESADIYTDSVAIEHLFSVVSSLDSIVLGETQIVGQVKDAFKFSFDHKFCGQKIARVMHHAFRCAAEVRNSTNISKNPISISSVAVAKAKEIFGGNLGGYSAVIVGAGEMATLAAKHLATAGVNLIIVNRNMEKSYKLAEQIENVTVVVEPFSMLEKLINSYRIVFSATSAPEPIIKANMKKETTFVRHWFDIAVPRDIEDCDCEGVNIYSVDDLQDIMNQNIEMREKNSKIAFKIVKKFTEEFYSWLQTLSVDPLIKEIREMARDCSQREVQKAVKKGYISSDMQEQVEKILHQTFNMFLHQPTKVLKSGAGQPQSDTLVQSIQLFFGLNSKQKKLINTYKCDYQIEKDIKQKD